LTLKPYFKRKEKNRKKKKKQEGKEKRKNKGEKKKKEGQKKKTTKIQGHCMSVQNTTFKYNIIEMEVAVGHCKEIVAMHEAMDIVLVWRYVCKSFPLFCFHFLSKIIKLK